MSKFAHCISEAGGQAAVLDNQNSRFRDLKMFENPDNVLIWPDIPFKGNFSTELHGS